MNNEIPTRKLLNVDNLTQIVSEISCEYTTQVLSFLYENLPLFYSGLDHSNRDTKEFCQKILLQLACDEYNLVPLKCVTFEEELIVNALVNTTISEIFLKQVKNNFIS